MLPRGLRIEFWTCFPEVRGFEFGRASQRSDGLKFGRASQRPDGLKFGRASQRSVDLNLDMLPRGTLKLEFGRASQRSNGIGRYYSYQCVQAFYPNTCKINTFN